MFKDVRYTGKIAYMFIEELPTNRWIVRCKDCGMDCHAAIFEDEVKANAARLQCVAIFKRVGSAHEPTVYPCAEFSGEVYRKGDPGSVLVRITDADGSVKYTPASADFLLHHVEV